MNTSQPIRLTQYSHGAGCGCKISPAVLDLILHSDLPQPQFASLLVGNSTRDDAAVMDLGDGTAIISTTDFFMPIVDDGFDFGRIAAVNAISDIYAMGGSPLMAIAILGWPIDKLPPEAAQPVLEGGRYACAEAGIPLAGGHSIDCPEPIFGLAVTGRVSLDHVKKNSGAQEGDLLYMTKPLGVGILSTAQKKGILRKEDQYVARDSMIKLNKIGALLGKQPYVHAITDVTGFGLLGHLSEMCEGSELSAVLDAEAIPVIPEALDYLEQGAIPGGTKRNWASYGEKIGSISDRQKFIFCDPQTSGGLLIALDASHQNSFEQLMSIEGFNIEPIGNMIGRTDKLVSVQ